MTELICRLCETNRLDSHIPPGGDFTYIYALTALAGCCPYCGRLAGLCVRTLNTQGPDELQAQGEVRFITYHRRQMGWIVGRGWKVPPGFVAPRDVRAWYHRITEAVLKVIRYPPRRWKPP